jgi:hypothetical protein
MRKKFSIRIQHMESRHEFEFCVALIEGELEMRKVYDELVEKLFPTFNVMLFCEENSVKLISDEQRRTRQDELNKLRKYFEK